MQNRAVIARVVCGSLSVAQPCRWSDDCFARGKASRLRRGLKETYASQLSRGWRHSKLPHPCPSAAFSSRKCSLTSRCNSCQGPFST
eukprot:scaffold589553_cov18-Prasinocladus_malaysianus.AAC.1